MITAFIDGAAQPNPGPAACAAIIYGPPPDKPLLATLTSFLGETTNNAAEYAGLELALNFAIDHGYRELKVYSDSQLIVHHVNNEWRCKDRLLRWYLSNVWQLIRQLDDFEIEWIPRHLNTLADTTATLAIAQGNPDILDLA
jgi:ribonuclease HI